MWRPHVHAARGAGVRGVFGGGWGVRGPPEAPSTQPSRKTPWWELPPSSAALPPMGKPAPLEAAPTPERWGEERRVDHVPPAGC